MPTAEKRAILDEISETLQNSGALYVTKYQGMSVAQANKLRGAFRKGNVHYKEVGGYDEMLPLLTDQNAFAFVEEELSAPAKVLKDFIKENNDKPEFKAALIDGDFYGPDQLEALAAMKSKDEIIGDILGLLMAPITNVVGGLQAQGSNLVGAVKTIAEKGEN
jgi:large subunit ribosomal protein L10